LKCPFEFFELGDEGVAPLEMCDEIAQRGCAKVCNIHKLAMNGVNQWLCKQISLFFQVPGRSLSFQKAL